MRKDRILNKIQALSYQLKARYELIRFCEDEAAAHREDCIAILEKIEKLSDIRARQEPSFKVLELGRDRPKAS